jgi:ABC-type microcin C transport system duplicated ATPase subunit YejF
VVRAVDGVSFTVNKGETLALVGEVGLRQVHHRPPRPAPDRAQRRAACCSRARTSPASSGAPLKAFRRRAQIVFQDPYASLNPRLTVGQTITEPMEVHGSAMPPAAVPGWRSCWRWSASPLSTPPATATSSAEASGQRIGIAARSPPGPTW